MIFCKSFTLPKFYKDNRKFFLFIILMSVFRSAIADWYTVPTGSMKPTIQEGDRIVVNKMAYDIRVPFTNVSLITVAEPQHGEIIVFESAAADLRLIKRVVGLPGDVVAMRNEVLFINGKPLKYTNLENTNIESANLEKNSSADNSDISQERFANETLGNVIHQIKIDDNASDQLSNFGPITVPDNKYLVLGDNRRHSADSRVYGFVPRHELKGKATAIAFSVDYENYYLPKKERFFQSLYM
jgi:signal peptidase I